MNATYDTTPAERRVPDTLTKRDLSSSVPKARHEGQAGCHRSLENAHNESYGQSARVVAALRHDYNHETPKEDADGHDFLRRKAANQPSTWVLPEEVTGIYH